jgi:hypothetical protein
MPAPTLPDLQRHFWAALEGETAPALRDVVAGSDVLSPDDRIDIYASMYLWRLRDLLGADFPKVAAVLGPDAFTDLARRYLGTYPSTNPSARWVGRRLADFLGEFPLWAPWLTDLARLEWTRLDAFDAADAEPVRASDLAAVAPGDWPDLVFAPVPSLTVLESRWPIHQAWDDPAAWSGPDVVPSEVPTTVRVWRRGWQVLHVAVEGSEAPALGDLRAGATFGEICERFADQEPSEAAHEAGGLLARWVEDGVIASFRRRPS